MGTGIIVFICILIFVVYRNWQYNQPDKVINRLDLLILEREQQFEKDEQLALGQLHGLKDGAIKMYGTEWFQNKVKEHEAPGNRKVKVKMLVVHLREKYKNEPTKIVDILVDYLDWLSAEDIYFSWRTALDPSYIEHDMNQGKIKAMTIANRLSTLADKEILMQLSPIV